MRHQTNKIKFKDGQDSNTMIMRKLMYNFLRNAHITTSETKAKALKMYLDRLVSKTKEKTEANKNYVLGFFSDKTILKVLFEQLGPAVSKINGGFVKTIRLNQRETDGAMMVRVEWAHPVVLDWGDKKAEKIAADKKSAADTKVSKAKADKEVKKVAKDNK